MGAGSAILFWYAACCSGVVVTILVAWGLFAWGKREEGAKRKAALTDGTPSKDDPAS